LSDEQAAIATKSCRRQNFNIQGATGSAKCCCCITKAHLKLGSWAGYHEFVIANPVNKHDVILGRDFLKANDALIDHGNDSITLNGAIIHINAITCIESVPSNKVLCLCPISATTDFYSFFKLTRGIHMDSINVENKLSQPGLLEVRINLLLVQKCIVFIPSYMASTLFLSHKALTILGHLFGSFFWR